ncbi:uncharacterized protein LOC122951466 [Acropora millepora]|uniref:uncharacterized protein LOC122951466 n=1 Tax=Acropora millepora TaxID=45264 RepID=UPI001CF50DA2|nr:uncharacterized protein LOC122951466 [Acropora millepora]
MTVHLFGATSSPGCANFALKTTANQYESVCGKEAADFVRKDFFVDDGLKSVATVEQAKSLISSTRLLCQKGGFYLHKFTPNNSEVLNSLPPEDPATDKRNPSLVSNDPAIQRALGVHWCIETDTLQFRIELKDKPLSRRGILSTVSSIYDPLDLVAPVSLQGNRVQEIRDKTSPEQWRYIGTKQNPADIASRGSSVQELIDNRLWWNGPERLWKPDKDWILTDATSKIFFDDPEVKRGSVLATQVRKPSSVLEHLEYFSTWHRPKRAVAVCLLLQEKFRSPNQKEAKRDPSDSRSSKYIPVNVQELQNAESEIIKIVQGAAFPEDIISMKKLNVCEQTSGEKTVAYHNKAIKKASSLYQLDPFLDANGILRVGGRIRRSSLSYGAKHPIILPRKGHVTELIICHHHRIVEHQGRGITHNEIRSAGYWVIGGSSAVSNHIAQCVNYRKLRGTPQDQKMADLPEDRLEPAPPFTFSAVDYFGPWYVKEGRRELKRYGVLFTCLSSRAIHLEVSNSLDTDSFLNAYRRFVCRRGPVRQLRSDQGTNFVGAMNELQKAVTELNHVRIREELLSNNCDWVEFKPNVPHASHMGGVWERQIRSVRNVLASLLESHGTQLDDESLRTFMIEAEAIVNCRPLAVNTINSSLYPEPLTPNHLLTMKSKVVMPPPGHLQRTDLYLNKRWRRVQYLANEFWNRWKKEFVQSLQPRQKWIAVRRNLQVNNIVIVMDENLPRNR